MRQWLAGDLTALAAGITFLIAAVLPWAQPNSITFLSAWSLQLWGPLAVIVVCGLLLVAASATRSLATAFLGIVIPFVATITVLSVHDGLYYGLARLGYGASGDAAHVLGYGVSVMLFAGLLSGAGGFVTFVQRQPKVATGAPDKPPDKSSRGVV